MNQIFEEFRAAIYSVWHRRWIVLAAAWGICLLGWAAVALIPNSYESRARLFVQLDDVLAQQIGIGAGNRQRDIQRVRQTLVSTVNLEKVIRSTRIGEVVTSPREMEIEVEELADSIRVISEQDSLFLISASSGRSDLSDAENAVLAQEIVQRMIDIFREENLSGSRGEMRETLDFLEMQLEQRQGELEQAEKRRLEFQAANPELIVGAEAIAKKLEANRAELRGIDADMAAAQTALASINGQIASTPRSIVVPGAQGGPAGALAAAEATLGDLQARGLTDNHPDIVAAKRKVNSLKGQVGSGGTSNAGMPNPAYSSLLSIRAERQANLQSLRARRAALEAEVMADVANQSSEPEVAAEAQRISRDYDVLRKQYEQLLEDREELKLRGQVETERSAIKFEVIDPPTSPRSPSAPNRPLLLIGVLLAGVAVGAVLAFALSVLRSTFATSSKLEEALDLPVIGSISKTFNEAGRELRGKRMRQFIGGSASLVAVLGVLIIIEFVQRGTVV